MIRPGLELAARILAYPRPVVMTCNGHAMAMGAFLLLSADYRIGVAGPYKLVTNEVAIGIPMPRAGVEICRQRLSPVHFQRAVLLAEVYDPEKSMEAGFLDRVVAPSELESAASSLAHELAKLDANAYALTKVFARRAWIARIRSAIVRDTGELILRGATLLVRAKLRTGGTAPHRPGVG